MAYAFNNDRSKVEVYPADEIDDKLHDEILARSSEDTFLNGRIDNILVGYDDDPNKDSELVDIRLLNDGVSLEAAGDAVRTQANRFEVWCENMSDQELVPISYYKKFIRDNYSAGTELTNVDNPADVTDPNDKIDLYVIDCSPGDNFILNVRGGASARAWCFIDSDNLILDKSTSGAVLTNEKIIAPANADRLIVHDYDCNKAVFKNISSREYMHDSGSAFAENYVYDYEKDGSYVYIDLHQASDQHLYIRGAIHTLAYIGALYEGTMPSTGNPCMKIPYGKDAVLNVRTKQFNVVDSGNHSKDEILLFRINTSGDFSNSGFMENDLLERKLQKQINNINHAGLVPTYYSSHIATAISNIISNINGSKSSDDPYIDVESFVFITDVHWGNNAKKSPSLVNEIIKQTPVDLIICGGDILYSHQATKQGAIAEMTDFINKMRSTGAEFHCAYGNHDDNSNSNSDILSKLTKQEQFNVFYEFNAGRKNVEFCFEDSNLTWTDPIKVDYYFDRPMTKTRFVVIDWNNPMSGSRVTWLQSVLSRNDGYRVVVIYHGIYSYSGNPVPEHIQIMSVLEPYKSKIVAMFCGHMHEDYVEQDYYGNGSFPVIFTSCDMLSTGMSAGTVTEQCFDVVTIDYKNDEIKLERIGYGNSRTVSL